MLTRLLACASVCALAAGANVVATTSASAAEARPANAVEEVVVTARKVEENVQNIPIAVSAFSDKKLKELVVNNIADLSKLAPSLQTQCMASNRSGCLTPNIRGQGTSFGTNAPSVPTYFADVPNFQFTYFDLQNLQVLKGPQGTLFGENSTGGALLVEPKKPGNSFEGYARFQLGNYYYKSAEVAVGGPIIADKLMFRVSGLIRLRDGFTKEYPSFAGPRNLAEPRLADDVNDQYLRISLVWKPFENVENYTIYAPSRVQQNGSGTNLLYARASFVNPALRDVIPANDPAATARYYAATGVLPPAGQTWGQLVENAALLQVALGPRAASTDYDRSTDIRYQGVINQTRWDLNDNFAIKNNFGLYWQTAIGTNVESDASNIPALDTNSVKNPAICVTGTANCIGGGNAKIGGWPARNWSEEIQAQGKLLDNHLQWQAGYFLEKRVQRQYPGTVGSIQVIGNYQGLVNTAATCATFGIPATTPCTTITRAVVKDSGMYAQGTYAILDNLHFTAGVRRSWDYRQTDSTAGNLTFVTVMGQQIPLAQKTAPIPGATISSSIVPRTKADTYTLALDYQINDKTLIYITHRTGYKPGGINGNTPLNDPNRFFGPEHIKDVEAGVKSDWEVGGVTGRTNVAVYKNWYSGIQRTTVLTGTAQTVTLNLANGIIQGLELEATIFPTRWLELGGFFAYTDAKFTNYTQTSTCATQYYRPQCAGLPGATPVIINHSAGQLLVNGTTTPFTPDLFNSTSKFRWSITPKIHLDEWLGEDVSISGNVNYRSKFANTDDNYSLFAGNVVPHPFVLGGTISNSLVFPGYTLVDLRADWRNIHGSRVSVGAAVTNLTNKAAIIGATQGLAISGTSTGLISEPRMWFVELTYTY